MMKRFRFKLAIQCIIDAWYEAVKYRDYGAAHTNLTTAYDAVTKRYGQFPGEKV